jgi:hypothetical protein
MGGAVTGASGMGDSDAGLLGGIDNSEIASAFNDMSSAEPLITVPGGAGALPVGPGLEAGKDGGIDDHDLLNIFLKP